MSCTVIGSGALPAGAGVDRAGRCSLGRTMGAGPPRDAQAQANTLRRVDVAVGRVRAELHVRELAEVEVDAAVYGHGSREGVLDPGPEAEVMTAEGDIRRLTVRERRRRREGATAEA